MLELRELSLAEACQDSHILSGMQARFIPESERSEGSLLIVNFLFACECFFWLNYAAETSEEATQIAQELRRQLLGKRVSFLEEDGAICPFIVSLDDDPQDAS